MLVWDLVGDRRFHAPTPPLMLTDAVGSLALPSPDGRTVLHIANPLVDRGGTDIIRFLDVATQRWSAPQVVPATVTPRMAPRRTPGGDGLHPHR